MSSNRVPRVFVGSSEEGLEVAQALQAALGAEYDVSVWNQGTFVMSGTGIHSLLRASQRHDFAVFVLTADDKLTTRRSTRPAARDNVLFEAGLFIGAIGLDRTFLVCSKGLRLPSDLAGGRLRYLRNETTVISWRCWGRSRGRFASAWASSVAWYYLTNVTALKPT